MRLRRATCRATLTARKLCRHLFVARRADEGARRDDQLLGPLVKLVGDGRQRDIVQPVIDVQVLVGIGHALLPDRNVEERAEVGPRQRLLRRTYHVFTERALDLRPCVDQDRQDLGLVEPMVGRVIHLLPCNVD